VLPNIAIIAGQLDCQNVRQTLVSCFLDAARIMRQRDTSDSHLLRIVSLNPKAIAFWLSYQLVNGWAQSDGSQGC
jgi:hypothetical protein